MALATLNEARQFIGFPSSDDALMQVLLDRASADVENYTKRRFEIQSYTEEFNGGNDSLILDNYPVISITSIRDFADPNNPVTVDSSTYTLYPNEGHVVLSARGFGLPSTWAFGIRRWEVNYSAGFNTIPLDITQAVLFSVSSWYNNRDGGEFRSESIGDYSYTVSEIAERMGLPSTVKRILSSYVRVVF